MHLTFKTVQSILCFKAAGVIDNRHRQRLVQTLQHCLGKMGGRNEIDIMCTLSDKLVIDFLQTFNGNFLAEALAADVIVLAENAVQITAGKENRAAAFCSADDGLFPHMQAGAGNNRSEAYTAAAKAAGSIRHICRAVYATAMRTYITESHIISSFEKSLPCLFGICIDKNTWFSLGGTVER